MLSLEQEGELHSHLGGDHDAILVLLKPFVLCLVAQSCLTLCTLWTAVRQAPLPVGILQARILEWVAMPSSRGLSQPRNQTEVSHFVDGFFTV